jgi:hypothetical protein
MKNVAIAVSLFAAAAFGAHAQVGLTTEQLKGDWVFTVAGEYRQRLLHVENVPAEGEPRQLVAGFSWVDETPKPPKAVQWSQAGQLTVVTDAGTRVVLRPLSETQMEGTNAYTNGVTKTVRAVKVTEQQLQERREAAKPGAAPVPGVPAECAAFHGGWAGRAAGMSLRVWVVNINADCVAALSFAASSDDSMPTRFSNAEIKNGKVEVKMPAGQMSLEVKGAEMYGRMIGSGQAEVAVLKPIR